MPKIFLYCIESELKRGGILCYALAEDGCILISHVSKSKRFAKHDLGLTSNSNHDKYAEHYSNGFELEWVDDCYAHDAFIKGLDIELRNGRTVAVSKIEFYRNRR